MPYYYAPFFEQPRPPTSDGKPRKPRIRVAQWVLGEDGEPLRGDDGEALLEPAIIPPYTVSKHCCPEGRNTCDFAHQRYVLLSPVEPDKAPPGWEHKTLSEVHADYPHIP